MSIQDPQFLYIILILPSLFGLTLLGEGIYKCAREEWSGLISIFFGLIFFAMVIFAYYLFSSYMVDRSV